MIENFWLILLDENNGIQWFYYFSQVSNNTITIRNVINPKSSYVTDNSGWNDYFHGKYNIKNFKNFCKKRLDDGDKSFAFYKYSTDEWFYAENIDQDLKKVEKSLLFGRMI